jgi:hypothetical protein
MDFDAVAAFVADAVRHAADPGGAADFQRLLADIKEEDQPGSEEARAIRRGILDGLNR